MTLNVFKKRELWAFHNSGYIEGLTDSFLAIHFEELRFNCAWSNRLNWLSYIVSNKVINHHKITESSCEWLLWGHLHWRFTKGARTRQEHAGVATSFTTITSSWSSHITRQTVMSNQIWQKFTQSTSHKWKVSFRNGFTPVQSTVGKAVPEEDSQFKFCLVNPCLILSSHLLFILASSTRKQS